jgi:hypothetical protein
MKQPFLAKKLRYSAMWTPSVWQRYFQVSTAAELKRKLESIDSVAYKLGKGDRLFLEYFAPAVRKAKYNSRDAFANAVLHWGLDGLYDFVSFDDSTAIPKSLISEVQDLADKITASIEWRTGDLVMIDNTRIMHGRRPFTNTQRKLHVRMGKSLDLPPAAPPER